MELGPVVNQHSHFPSILELILRMHSPIFASVDVIPGLLVFHTVTYIFMSFITLLSFQGPG